MNGEALMAWQGVIVFLVALPVLAIVITVLGRQYRRVAEARAALASKGARVFVICGSAHAVQIEPALR